MEQFQHLHVIPALSSTFSTPDHTSCSRGSCSSILTLPRQQNLLEDVFYLSKVWNIINSARYCEGLQWSICVKFLQRELSLISFHCADNAVCVDKSPFICLKCAFHLFGSVLAPITQCRATTKHSAHVWVSQLGAKGPDPNQKAGCALSWWDCPRRASEGLVEVTQRGFGVCACACLSAALISIGSHPLGTWGQGGVHAMLKVKSHALAHGRTQTTPKCLAHSTLSKREFQRIFLQLKMLNL